MSVQGKASCSPKWGHTAMQHQCILPAVQKQAPDFGYKSWVVSKQIFKRAQDGTTQEVEPVRGMLGLHATAEDGGTTATSTDSSKRETKEGKENASRV